MTKHSAFLHIDICTGHFIGDSSCRVVAEEASLLPQRQQQLGAFSRSRGSSSVNRAASDTAAAAAAALVTAPRPHTAEWPPHRGRAAAAAAAGQSAARAAAAAGEGERLSGPAYAARGDNLLKHSTSSRGGSFAPRQQQQPAAAEGGRGENLLNGCAVGGYCAARHRRSSAGRNVDLESAAAAAEAAAVYRGAVVKDNEEGDSSADEFEEDLEGEILRRKKRQGGPQGGKEENEERRHHQSAASNRGTRSSRDSSSRGRRERQQQQQEAAELFDAAAACSSLSGGMTPHAKERGSAPSEQQRNSNSHGLGSQATRSAEGGKGKKGSSTQADLRNFFVRKEASCRGREGAAAPTSAGRSLLTPLILTKRDVSGSSTASQEVFSREDKQGRRTAIPLQGRESSFAHPRRGRAICVPFDRISRAGSSLLTNTQEVSKSCFLSNAAEAIDDLANEEVEDEEEEDLFLASLGRAGGPTYGIID